MERIHIYKATDGTYGAMIDGVSSHYFVKAHRGGTFTVSDGDSTIVEKVDRLAAERAMLADWDRQ